MSIKKEKKRRGYPFRNESPIKLIDNPDKLLLLLH